MHIGGNFGRAFGRQSFLESRAELAFSWLELPEAGKASLWPLTPSSSNPNYFHAKNLFVVAALIVVGASFQLAIPYSQYVLVQEAPTQSTMAPQDEITDALSYIDDDYNNPVVKEDMQRLAKRN
ncbi:heat shock 70 kDa protein 1-like [Striga asiatica]|uniref:Heat shock 70 kDa protein 1-like n=1 Tax=Striga asiatica TaxID=4170 RepID=A0A5A7QGR2_STRAF|nr:heat shock 70 kDa protein 1-like [Striga asiatica]